MANSGIMEALGETMWEDLFSKMSWSRLETMKKTSKEMMIRIEESPHYQKLAKLAKKAAWFAKRIQRITDADRIVCRHHEWDEMGVSYSYKLEEFYPELVEQGYDLMWMSWHRGMKKFIVRVTRGYDKNFYTFVYNKIDFIEMLMKMYKLTIPMEKRQILTEEDDFDSYFRYGMWQMSMKKEHDLWLYRLSEEADLYFDLDEKQRMVFREIPELKEAVINLANDFMYLTPSAVVISREGTEVHRIDLDRKLFLTILDKVEKGNIEFMTNINYANQEVPFYDAENYMASCVN